MGQWLTRSEPSENTELSYRKRAEAAALQAEAADKKKNNVEALDYYTKAVGCFIKVCKFEPLTEEDRSGIQSRCDRYLTRCDELKTLIEATSDQEEKEAYQKNEENILKNYAVERDGKVKLEDVAGLQEIVKVFKENVILPFKMPDGGKPVRSILLYGAPGTGKTFAVRAFSNECEGVTFLRASSSDFISKYVGESPQIIAAIFQVARAKSPSVVFIDDIDMLLVKPKDREMSEAVTKARQEVLQQIIGLDKDDQAVTFIGATSLPWTIDETSWTLFKKKLYVRLPDVMAREAIIQRLLEQADQRGLTDADLRELADATDGFSGADCHVFVRDALMQPVRQIQKATHFKLISVNNADVWTTCAPDEPGAVRQYFADVPEDSLHVKPLTMDDLRKSLASMKPSVSTDDVEKFETFHSKW